MNKHLTFFLFFLFFTGFTTKAQIIQTIAGTGVAGYSGDHGPAISAKLYSPYGVVLDDLGNLYICDENNACIRKVSPARGGIITTIAGNGTGGYSGDGYLGIYAQLNGAYDVAIDHHGNVYIADAGNNCIRKVTPGDTINTIAGNGMPGFSGDHGPASAAQLNAPYGIAVDSVGNIYFADAYNYRIRKIDSAGIITTVAGTGSRGYSADGIPASTADLTPLNVRIDRAGNLYISDSARVRKISPAVGGIITTVAGNGTPGFSGDSGMATNAKIVTQAIALDTAGNLFIADVDADRIRKVNIAGVINTIVGSAMGGYGGDGGNPLLAELCFPLGIAVSNTGDLFIGDACNERIRMVTNEPLRAINAYNQDQSIDIFPNPCHGNFSFTISSNRDEPAQVVITNILGEKIAEFSSVTNQQFEVSHNLTRGIYFLSATIAQKQYNQKIMIQ